MTTQTVIAQATGNIEVEGDSDWFKVSLNAGTEYIFNITGNTLSGNGSLSLYDSNGNPVSSAGSVANGTQIVFEPTSSGTYYVGASGGGTATGTYTINEATAPFDFAGNASTAGTVAVGGQATGTLATSGQTDWFKVQLTAGTGYALHMTGGAGAQVALYDSNGNLVDSGNFGSTLYGNNAFYVPTTSGTYYVAASDIQGGTGAFSVSVNTASYDFTGNTQTTGTVSVGGTATGTLANVGQSDWFKVSLAAGSEYVFNVNGSGGLLPGVTVYNSAGVAVAGTLYTGGTNGGAMVTFEPTAAGTYYVGVSSNISTTGGFTVGVSTATVDVLGTTATTGVISNGAASGNITTATQSDWFKVSLTAGSAYEIAASGALANANVAVYDANGNALTNGASQTLFEPTSSGTYFIGVAGSGTGAFNVSVGSVSVDHLGNINSTASISVGHSLSGTLANAGQSDWYKVTLTAGQQYLFTETGNSLTNPEVAVYNSTGTQVAVSADGGANGSSVISFTPTTTGTYFVSASSAGSTTGTYTLAAAAQTDDHSDTTSTTGTFSGVLSVAAAIADNAAGTLTAGSQVVDTAADVQSGLDSLQALVAAGKVSSISLLDSPTATITVTADQIASDAPALRDISSAFTLNISGYSTALSNFVQSENFNYIPGTSHSGSDQVIEISSLAAGAAPIALGSGFNAIIIDGVHSSSASAAGQPDSFSFNVQANGTLTLLDNNTGHSVTVTGDTYLIFNDAASTTNGPVSSFNSMFFIAGSLDAQITSIYNAAFLRQPDLGGLEFYANLINQGKLSIDQAAAYFLASNEFKTDYPAAALPSDNGGPNDQAFITTLYENVLHRAPDAGGMATYISALKSGAFDRADLLEFFAFSNENQTNISDFVINTTNGAYADSSTLLSASTVLSQVSGSDALNTAAISPTSIGAGITSNGISIAGNDAITLTASAPTETVYLSATFSAITVQNSGSTIYDAAGGSTITLSGAANTTLTVTNGGGSDLLNLVGGTATTINGFVAGSGSVLNVTGMTNPANVEILNGATTQVAGSNLTFGNGTAYVVEVGTVSDHTAATMAAAINKAYAATGATNEAVTFLAQDSSGNTLVWSWTTPSAGNAGHTITASGLVDIATIVGVAPSALTVNDLA